MEKTFDISIGMKEAQKKLYTYKTRRKEHEKK